MCVRAEVCFAFQHASTGDSSTSSLHSLDDILKWEIVSTVNLRLFRVLISTMLALSRITGSVLWIRVRSIWKRLRIVSTTLQRPMDSPPSVASASNGNTNLIAPSETVEETPATGGDFSEDGKPVLEATADSSATVGPDVPSASSVAGPPIDPVDDIDEESNSDYDTDSDDISDEESFCDRYRESWVCQSATQTEKKFKCISRASPFRKSPFPPSLRPAKRNRLSRFQSSGPTPVEVLLYHPPLRTLPALPSALKVSWSN